MALSDIGLTSAMRSNLYSLQQTSTLMNRTQTRLATGKKVNSSLDDPAKYFAAQDHMNRASDLDRLKSGMGEAIQTLKAADKGIDGITSLIEEARGLADSARSGDSATKGSLASQFNSLITQMKDLAADASYKGINLINNDNLSVQFEGSHGLAVTGIDASKGSSFIGGLKDAAAGAGYNNFSSEADIANAIKDINTVLSNFRAASATLASNEAVITTRQDFTSKMIETLQTGATQLTEADLNEESANMLALQTKQQLGISALSLASQAQQSVLKLL